MVVVDAPPALSRFRFGDVTIRHLGHPLSGQRTVWDELTIGLGLKVGRRTKSFVVRYRVGGREREMTLGRWPQMSLADARRRAREVRAGAFNGIDPILERRARRAELSPDATFEATVRRYWETDPRHLNLRKRRDEERLLERHVLPRWGEWPISRITTADALDLLEEIAGSFPIAANRVLFALRRPFRWAVQRRMTETSPVESVERLTPETSRTRVLTDSELKLIWAACDDLGIFGSLVRGLIVTGSRRDELRNAKWAEFDRERMIWLRPAIRMKGRVDHILPVTPLLDSILERIPENPGFVFSTDGGLTRYAALSRAKDRLDELSNTSGWTLHDIRRTVRTRLADLGVPFEVAEKVLAHRTDRIELVYNHSEYLPQKREALTRWEAHLISIIS